MKDEHEIHGLLHKRSDIAGQIAVVHDQLKALQGNLAHVEATLRMFKPDIDFSGARVSRLPGQHAAAYGDMSKAVRNVLRDAKEPLTIAQMADAVILALGIQDADLTVVRKRVGSSVRNLKRRGQAESRQGLGLALEWSLKP